MKKIKWTKEKCQEEALKYNTRYEFSKNSGSAYNSSKKNNWLNDICSHMIIKHKDYNKEDCLKASLKCNSQKEFRDNYPSEYQHSYKNNIMRECCSHMIENKKLCGYWTKEKCQEEALKYEARTTFYIKSAGASFAASKNNWMVEICSHMKIKRHDESYWTKEICQELALTCKSRTEFFDKYNAAHKYSIKNGWIDEICSHMKATNKKYRCIYAYEFSDNSVYIGLTCDLNKRKSKHKNDDNSSVYKHIKNTKLIPIIIKLTDYVCNDDAKNMEEFFLQKYKNNGWKTLNVVKTGGLGGNILIWTKEKCQEAALKCKTRNEFYKNYNGAIATSLKNNWMNEICSHIDELSKRKHNGYWTYENCLNAAIEQKTLKNFKANAKKAQSTMYKNRWKDKIYTYMNWNKQK